MPRLEQFRAQKNLTDGLLRDGDWDQLWTTLPRLSLMQSLRMLAVIKASGWMPQDKKEQSRLVAALGAADAIQKAYRDRRGVLTVERTIPLRHSVRSVAVDPNGGFVVTGFGIDPPRELRLEVSLAVWEPETGACLGTATPAPHYLDRISVAPSGLYMAVSGYHDGVHVVKLPHCTEVRTLDPGSYSVPFCFHTGRHCFHPDGSLFVAQSHSRGVSPRTRPGDTPFIHCLRRVYPDTWDWHDVELGTDPGDVWSLAVDPSANYVAAGLGLGDGVIVVRDVRSGRVVTTLRGHEGSVRHICFSPDGRYLASASYDTTVKLWDTGTWTELNGLPLPPPMDKYGHRDGNPQFCCAFSPDSSMLLAVTMDPARKPRTVKLTVFAVPTFGKIMQMDGCSRKPDHFMFNQSGTAFVTGTIEGQGFVQVWSGLDGSLLHTFDNAYIGKLSSDGNRLFVAKSGLQAVLEIVRTEVIDFLLLPLPELPSSICHAVAEICNDRTDRVLESRLVELARLLRPEAEGTRPVLAN